MSLIAQPIALDGRLAEHFWRVCQQPYALLLDSCDAAAGQWDLLFWQPQQVVTDSTAWPTQLAHLLTQLPSYQGPSELPFQGGLAGALSYDAGRALERLPNHAQADIALPLLAVGCYHQALMQRRADGQTWLLAPSTDWSRWADFWQQAATPPVLPPLQLLKPWQSNLSAEAYLQRFAKVQHYLAAGDCYQINLAQRFSAPYQGDPYAGYWQLRNSNNAPFSAFLRLPEGALLSLSPERFLQVQTSGEVETKPIKGTRPRHADAGLDQQFAEALAASSKDRAENVMIVDLLRNDLSRCCLPGSVQVPKLFAIESYPAVHHLVSTVRGRLAPDANAISLLAACFPGGSITGAPKIRAMEIIDELEPHRRSYYCGSFGYWSQHGSSDTSIAIRTLVASAGQLHCWAGGGLVADSEGAAEYQETLDKVARILPLLEVVDAT